MKSWFLLNVVVRKGSSIFQLLSSEDQSLLIGWDSFLILDLGLDVFNSVRSFNIKSDGLSSQSLNKDLHSSSQSQHQVESWFFLDVIVTEGSSIFKLLSGKDESLLIGWDSFFVLDFSLHIFNGVSGFNIEGDGLSCEGLHKDLHSSSKSQD